MKSQVAGGPSNCGELITRYDGEGNENGKLKH